MSKRVQASMRLEHARRDYYRRLAKEQGYKSRAAYKLLEIDNSFHIFKKGQKVLDIGCYPGGWLQVASSKVGRTGLVIGIDIRRVDYKASNVKLIEASVEDDGLIDKLYSILNNSKVDLILSDISPNLSGVWSLDHARQIHLSSRVLSIADSLLISNGSAVLKVFDGDMLKEFISKVKSMFTRVHIYKPRSSRKESSELYLVCLGYKHVNV